MEFSQATRQLRVETELGPDVLFLEGFSGTEAISTPFTFTVDMVSPDLSIDTAAILRTPIALVVTLEDGSERRIHGHIAKVTQLGQRDGIASYRAEMVPWFWFLGLNRESRIFQQMTVPEIVEQVLQDRGQSDFELHCTGSYPTVEYCVQYRESDLAFIQRLLEREGIYYFFRHDEDKAVLVIADDNSIFEKSPHQPELRFRSEGAVAEEVVSSFQQEHSVHVGTVTLRDYDPLQPNLDLSATLSGEEEQEYYDYPGAYAKLFCNDPGDVAGEAERYARLRLELEECRRHRAAGQGNCRGVLVGYTFELMDYYRDDANAEYVVTTLSHVARGGGYRSWGGGDVDYQCSFMVVSPDKPFRPELKTLRPVVEGTQTAVVVGPSGEEVWTDSHGRVKCQFHWDREGQNDENSSCWIRVATPWGGKGYGHVSIPRIGNEVVVEFLEGDPDQPLIVGSVYNADQTPPNPLPDSDIQMGMKTRSSKGGGGYNEISMTDTKGDELITIHGQHDMDTVVENDERLTVHHCRTQTVDVDEAITIGNDQTVDVGANRTETVGSNESITIGQDRSEQVAGAESVTIGKTREHKVGLNDSTLVGVSQEVVVGAARSITVGATHSTTIGIDDSKNVGSDMSLDVGKNRATSIGEEDTLTIGKKLVIDVGDEIVIKTGKASITMKKDGTIQIVGKDVTLQGSGKLNAKFSKDIVLKGKKILQN